jgi:putative PIN family toxin of toxin-antitoxin system
MPARVVFDTSVIVAALRSASGASNALLQLVASGRVIALATPPVFFEYEEVLKRPEHCMVHRLSHAEVEDFLAELAALVEPVETHFSWRPQVTDPSDEIVVEAVVNGRADALVTHNVRHFRAFGKRFGVPVLSPAEALRRLRQ